MTSSSCFVDYPLRVRYAETDRMGVAHHSNYLVWFELGRTEICRSRGFSYATLEKDARILLMVAEMHCRYHQPVTYDDPIVVRTALSLISPRLLKFAYEIRHATTDKLVATGESVHLPVDAEGRRTRIPQVYLDLLSGKHDDDSDRHQHG